MNRHLIKLIGDLEKARINLPDTGVTVPDKKISTLRYLEIVEKIRPALGENTDIMKRINGYSMVSYDRDTIRKVLRTKHKQNLSIRETAKKFGISKNTIFSWEKKLKSDPVMQRQVDR